jgi:hypothetical protein
MAKDSYPRFLQSKAYLDLLNSATPPPSATLEKENAEEFPVLESTEEDVKATE